MQEGVDVQGIHTLLALLLLLVQEGGLVAGKHSVLARSEARHSVQALNVVAPVWEIGV